jgi:hypothetical protein
MVGFSRGFACVWCATFAAIVFAPACNTFPRKKSVEEEQQERFGQAYVAISAKHPQRVSDLLSIIGADPAECTAASASESCYCAWRFLTKDGTKEIKAVAELSVEKVGDTIAVVDSVTGELLHMTPQAAQAAFIAGKARLRKGDTPVRLADGQIGTVPAENVQQTLDRGGSLISPSEYKQAELEAQYEKMSGIELIRLCVNKSGRVTAIQLGNDEMMRN